MCGLKKRTAQFAPFGRHQHAATPDVEITVELEFSNRIEYVVRHLRIIAGMGVIAEKTFRIDFELEVLMYLPIQVETSIIDAEIAAP